MVRRLARFVLIGGALIVLAGALSMVWLKAHEEELVFATARSQSHLLEQFPADVEKIEVSSAGGTGAAAAGLAALVFHADADADKGYWILQFHGNADSAFSPWQARHCEALRGLGFNVLEIDYRGFGLTPGKASEAGMIEDAETAYRYLRARGVPAGRIILLGHSLGSGPAVVLATRHSTAALVLFGAFTSIPDAAADRYPFLPLRMAVGVQFNSLARIGEVRMPVIIAHSRSDSLIPYSHALKLFAAAHEPKQLISFEASNSDGFGGHVDALFDHADRRRTVLAKFLPALSDTGSAPHLAL